jgi:hypothetical protein
MKDHSTCTTFWSAWKSLKGADETKREIVPFEKDGESHIVLEHRLLVTSLKQRGIVFGDISLSLFTQR